MNAPHDLDRQLATWLADGPSTSSERPVDAALAHAQAHPRRRDPLAFARKDAMSSQRSAAVYRSLPLVAVLGLLLAAAVAVAVAAGVFERRPAVVPPPVVTASPSTSPTQTTETPSPAATAGVGPVHVDLIDHAGGHGASVDITDLSGTLVKAETGVPGDGASVEDGSVLAVTLPASPNVLVLTWSGSPCDTTHAMTISADGRDIAIQRSACSGDAIPVDHVLELTFDHTIDLTSLSTTITTLP
jgi:hypothetical protein